MKKILYLAAFAAFALTSCSSDNNEGENNNNKVNKFYASLENVTTTRTTIDNSLEQTWEVGDQVRILGNKAATFTVAKAGKTDVLLTSPVGIEPAASGAKYRAFFPMYLIDGNDGSRNLPETYTWTEGKFNMPMHSKGDEDGIKLSFVNFCGVLTCDIPEYVRSGGAKYIRIQSSNQLWGKFKVGNEGNNWKVTFTDASQTDNKVILLDISSMPSSANSTTHTAYIPVVPGTQTLTLSVVKDDKTTLITGSHAVTTTSAVNIERNKIYEIDYMSL